MLCHVDWEEITDVLEALTAYISEISNPGLFQEGR
jgi:hypothetical protein